MKNLKKITCLMLISLLMFSMVACSKDAGKLDSKAFVDELLSSEIFDDELSQIDQETVESIYSIDSSKESNVYISSGATADEIAVFEFENEEESKKALELLEKRLEAQKEAFKDYAPEEMPKLENAKLQSLGNYAILVVSNSKDLDKIIKNNTK